MHLKAQVVVTSGFMFGKPQLLASLPHMAPASAARHTQRTWQATLPQGAQPTTMEHSATFLRKLWECSFQHSKAAQQGFDWNYFRDTAPCTVDSVRCDFSLTHLIPPLLPSFLVRPLACSLTRSLTHGSKHASEQATTWPSNQAKLNPAKPTQTNSTTIPSSTNRPTDKPASQSTNRDRMFRKPLLPRA